MDNDLSKLLKNARFKLNLSQRDLSLKSGVDFLVLSLTQYTIQIEKSTEQIRIFVLYSHRKKYLRYDSLYYSSSIILLFQYELKQNRC